MVTAATVGKYSTRQSDVRTASGFEVRNNTVNTMSVRE